MTCTIKPSDIYGPNEHAIKQLLIDEQMEVIAFRIVQKGDLYIRGHQNRFETFEIAKCEDKSVYNFVRLIVKSRRPTITYFWE